MAEKPLKIYDRQIDEYRPATQDDIDKLWRKVQQMGATIGAVRGALARFDAMTALDKEKAEEKSDSPKS